MDLSYRESAEYKRNERKKKRHAERMRERRAPHVARKRTEKADIKRYINECYDAGATTAELHALTGISIRTLQHWTKKPTRRKPGPRP